MAERDHIRNPIEWGVDQLKTTDLAVARASHSLRHHGEAPSSLPRLPTREPGVHAARDRRGGRLRVHHHPAGMVRHGGLGRPAAGARGFRAAHRGQGQGGDRHPRHGAAREPNRHVHLPDRTIPRGLR